MTEQIPPPGPERDARVAEVVMGWKASRVRLGTSGEVMYAWWDGTRQRTALPAYSTDPHCALDVLLEMGSDWDYDLSYRGEEGALGHRAFLWRRRDWPRMPYSGYGADWAAAITEAALRAKLGEAK